MAITAYSPACRVRTKPAGFMSTTPDVFVEELRAGEWVSVWSANSLSNGRALGDAAAVALKCIAK